MIRIKINDMELTQEQKEALEYVEQLEENNEYTRTLKK